MKIRFSKFVSIDRQCLFLVKVVIGSVVGARGVPSSPSGDPKDLRNSEQ